MRKTPFTPGEYYHIYNRTILNSPEFRDKKNADKLWQSFLLANSTNSTSAFEYLRTTKNAEFDKAIEISRKGEKIVDILCYSIMPDHYHLLLREKKEGGISEFIRKCNISVAKYINIKNHRRGPLFESRFHSKHVNNNIYLLHLSVYVHLNPLDILTGKEWRENKLKNWIDAKKKLINYSWSSARSFLDPNYNDLIISGTEIILDQFKNKKEYELFLRNWSQPQLEEIESLL